MAQWLNSCLWRRSNRELPPSGQITRLGDFSLCVLQELSMQQSKGALMVCSHLASYKATLAWTPWATSWACQS